MDTTEKTEDKLVGAKRQGQAQFESILEMVRPDWEQIASDEGWVPYTDKFGVASWRTADGDTFAGTARQLCTYHDLEESERARETREQRIHEDALSVEVRSEWISIENWGRAHGDQAAPAEYRILLCTGGPACQIVGRLNEHCEPETAVMQVQDWFQPWTEFRPTVPAGAFPETGDAENDPGNVGDAESIMLAYARCFWFGE